MSSEVVVDVNSKEVSIALLEDGKLMELQKEVLADNFAVGNIYVARVRKMMAGLNACFVDLGYSKAAFLHMQDMHETIQSYQKYMKRLMGDRKHPFPITNATLQPTLPKDGNIKDVVKQGDILLAQIIKEPISTKGPRLTCEISFAGRLLVLIPMSEKVSVSTKIKSNSERSRLKRIVESIKPKNFGVIVRTVA